MPVMHIAEDHILSYIPALLSPPTLARPPLPLRPAVPRQRAQVVGHRPPGPPHRQLQHLQRGRRLLQRRPSQPAQLRRQRGLRKEAVPAAGAGGLRHAAGFLPAAQRLAVVHVRNVGHATHGAAAVLPGQPVSMAREAAIAVWVWVRCKATPPPLEWRPAVQSVRALTAYSQWLAVTQARPVCVRGSVLGHAAAALRCAVLPQPAPRHGARCRQLPVWGAAGPNLVAQAGTFQGLSPGAAIMQSCLDSRALCELNRPLAHH